MWSYFNILTWHGTLHRKEMKTPKKQRLEGLYIILIKGDKLWRSDQTKEKVLGSYRAVNGVKVTRNYIEQNNGRQDYFNKVILHRLILVSTPTPGDKNVLSFLYWQGISLLEVRILTQRICSFLIFIDIGKLLSMNDAPIHTLTGGKFPKLWSVVGYLIFGTLRDDKMAFWYGFNLHFT